MTETTMRGVQLDDLVQPFQIDAFGLRGRLVRLGPAFHAMVHAHDYPPPVRQLLGEAAALAATLAAALKYQGLFSLQLKSDGAVNLLSVDVTSDGDLRGYARYDDVRVAAQQEGHAGTLLGAGLMAFTVDQGPDTERYQGITELTAGSLAECAHAYFRQSEQLETAIKVTASSDLAHLGAASLMIQRLPGEGGLRRGEQDPAQADENWRQAVILLGSVTAAELLDPALAPADVLYRLYHAEGVRLYDHKPLRHRCRCSYERVARTLASFPDSELQEYKDDGHIVVTCEFCKTVYDFDEVTMAREFTALRQALGASD